MIKKQVSSFSNMLFMGKLVLVHQNIQNNPLIVYCITYISMSQGRCKQMNKKKKKENYQNINKLQIIYMVLIYGDLCIHIIRKRVRFGYPQYPSRPVDTHLQIIYKIIF